jgi:hypothetical protein
MDYQKKDIAANSITGAGILFLFASYILPALSGLLFPDKIMRGWEVVLFTLSGALHFMDGGLDALLAGLFLCNLILVIGIILFFGMSERLRWYRFLLAIALLYVFSFSIFVMGPEQLALGTYTYLLSFTLINTSFFLKTKR